MIKKLFSQFKEVRSGIFLTLFLISLVVSIVALRHNNQTMVKLRQAVYQADKTSQDVNRPLNDLREYVYSHMNTNLSSGGNAIKPPVQLKYTYERLQAAAQKKADEANSQLYTDAQIYCQQQNSVDFSGRNRVPCVTAYVTSHGGAQAKTIPVSLYQFDFVSPSWSPDLAGWSLVLTVIFLVLFLSRFVIDKLVRHRLEPI